MDFDQEEMNEEKFNHIEMQVYEVLYLNKLTRDCDMLLYLEYYRAFYSDAVNGGSINIYELKKYFGNGDRFKTLTRARCRIQNELNKLLPIDPKVRKARRISEENYKKSLGYSVQEETGQLEMVLS